jgi:hypothetical protein
VHPERKDRDVEIFLVSRPPGAVKDGGMGERYYRSYGRHMSQSATVMRCSMNTSDDFY